LLPFAYLKSVLLKLNKIGVEGITVKERFQAFLESLAVIILGVFILSGNIFVDSYW